MKQNLQIKKKRRKTGKQLWDDAISFVVNKVLHCGSKPLLPIEDLPLTEKFFHGPNDEFVDLRLPEFRRIFVNYFRNRLGANACPSIGRITEWFREIDADCSNGVSWDEFSSFNISTATTQDSENVRAREVIDDPVVKGRSHSNEHHFPISKLDASGSSPYVVSCADDGFVKLWNASDGSFVHSINNSLFSASRPRIRAGATAPIHPIVDVRFDSRGTGCFVTATDKSLHVYDGSSFELLRKYVGTHIGASEASLSIGWRNSLGCKSIFDAHDKFKLAQDVEPTLLLEFGDCPTAMDVAAPLSGRELLVFGTDRGEVLIYPSMRNVHIPDIAPACRYVPHSDSISKLRYLPRIDSIATGSWDCSVQLLDVETGIARMKFEGAKSKFSRSLVGGSTSVLSKASEGEDEDSDDRTFGGHQKIVIDFAYDSVQNLIASAGMDRVVLLWSATYNQPLCGLQGHAAPLRAVSFAENDRLLFSMDQSGVVLSWDLRVNRVLQTVSLTDSAEEDALDANLSANQRMSAMMFDVHRSKLYCGNVAVKSWTMRRALGGFPASHIGHVDNIIAFSIIPETSSIISTDRHSTMRWNALRGARRCMWQNEDANLELAAVATDASGRKLIAIDEEGVLMLQNAANGLVLRSSDLSSFITATPFRILSKKGWTAVVTPNEVVVFAEDLLESLKDNPPQVIQAPRDSCFTAAVFPQVGGVVLGTSTGALLSFMASRDTAPVSVTMHPRILKTRQSRSRQSRSRVTFKGSVSDSRSGRRKSRSRELPEEPAPKMTLPASSAVEDICFLPHCELVATCTGDGHIFFWDSSASVLKGTFTTNLKPEECLLCLCTCDVHVDIATMATSAKRRQSLLIASCDWGFVYVRDATLLPHQSSPMSDFAALTLPLLHIFRAHNDPITQLAPFAKYNVIVTLSAYDSMIKMFTMDGALVGYLGQEEAWHLNDKRTFGRNRRAVPLDDGTVPPRPSTANPRQLLTTPGSSDATFLTSSKLMGEQFVPVVEDVDQRRASDDYFARRFVSLSGTTPEDCSSPVTKGSGLLKASLSMKKRFTPAEAQTVLGTDRVRRLASLGRIPDLREPDCELLLPVQATKAPRRLSTLPRSQSMGAVPKDHRNLQPISRSHSDMDHHHSVPVRQSSIGLLHQAVSVEQELFAKKTIKGDLTENLVVRNKLLRDSGQVRLEHDEWSSRASALLAIHEVPASTLLLGGESPVGQKKKQPRIL